MKYTILDLDNCLSDDGWRQSRIRAHDAPNRFHDYHLLAPFDEMRNGNIVCPNGNNIFLTARPISFLVSTQEWLKRNEIEYRHLMMRPAGCEWPSPELKKWQLERLEHLCKITTKHIKCAYDDRQDIVDMYVSIGIKAKRVAINEN